MKNLSVCMLICLLLGISTCVSAQEMRYPLFLMVEFEGGVSIEKMLIAEGRTEVLTDPHIIGVVLTFPVGSKSGDFIKGADRGGMFIVQAHDGKLRVALQRKDGDRREMPPIEITAAEQVTIRVNITGAGGYQKAFRIVGYNTVEEDNGPVIDMFGGRVPMSEGDYSITLESLHLALGERLEGTIPLVTVRNWFAVEGEIPGGGKGSFVVDFGATSTVISRDICPPDAELQKMKIVQYSAKGKKEMEGAVPGAGGMVDNIEGILSTEYINLGDLKIPEATLTVIKDYPKALKETGISGIIGVDILSRADSVVITKGVEYGPPSFSFGESRLPDKPADIELPYAVADNKIIIEGSVLDKPVSWVLDTGSTFTIIDKEFFETNNLDVPMTKVKGKSSGLDGVETEHSKVELDKLTLNDVDFEVNEMLVGNLFFFDSLGTNGRIGLLGADFLQRFSAIQFDMKNHVVRLWN